MPDVRFLHRDDSSTLASITYTASLNDNAWHRFCTVRKSNNSFELWVDAVSRGTSTSAPGTTTINGVSIGNFPRSANEFFIGDIAEILRLNVSLADNLALEATRIGGAMPTQAQIGDSTGYWPLWGVASPEPDLSGNGNNGTVTGAALADHCPCGPYR